MIRKARRKVGAALCTLGLASIWLTLAVVCGSLVYSRHADDQGLQFTLDGYRITFHLQKETSHE